jgi:5'-nucleotidase
MSAAVENFSWDPIDTVFLDLDGTLLDLSFDSDFWLDSIPRAYAVARGLSVEQARGELAPRFRAIEGTLDWYCIDYWTRELGLHVAALKRTQAHRVAWLPGAEDFLRSVRKLGKRVVLLTNAHPQVLQIKDEQTGVTRYLDAAISSHRFGWPKESRQFWRRLQEVEPFDPGRTVFLDDSPAVLSAAREAGIRWVYGIRRADTTRPPREHEAPAIDSVSDLGRGLPSRALHGVGAAGAPVPDGRRQSAVDAAGNHILPPARP